MILLRHWNLSLYHSWQFHMQFSRERQVVLITLHPSTLSSAVIHILLFSKLWPSKNSYHKQACFPCTLICPMRVYTSSGKFLPSHKKLIARRIATTRQDCTWEQPTTYLSIYYKKNNQTVSPFSVENQRPSNLTSLSTSAVLTRRRGQHEMRSPKAKPRAQNPPAVNLFTCNSSNHFEEWWKQDKLKHKWNAAVVYHLY